MLETLTKTKIADDGLLADKQFAIRDKSLYDMEIILADNRRDLTFYMSSPWVYSASEQEWATYAATLSNPQLGEEFLIDEEIKKLFRRVKIRGLSVSQFPLYSLATADYANKVSDSDIDNDLTYTDIEYIALLLNDYILSKEINNAKNYD